MVETQLGRQLKEAGYRVALLNRENYQELWSQHASAVGGIFDQVTGATKPGAYSEAISTLARTICDELKCDLVVQQRLIVRPAEVKGTQVEWDGVRQPIQMTNTFNREYRSNGKTSALSLELRGRASTGSFAFRKTVGVTQLFETNMRDIKNEPRKELFPNDSEVANAVTIALEPLIRKRDQLHQGGSATK